MLMRPSPTSPTKCPNSRDSFRAPPRTGIARVVKTCLSVGQAGEPGQQRTVCLSAPDGTVLTCSVGPAAPSDASEAFLRAGLGDPSAYAARPCQVWLVGYRHRHGRAPRHPSRHQVRRGPRGALLSLSLPLRLSWLLQRTRKLLQSTPSQPACLLPPVLTAHHCCHRRIRNAHTHRQPPSQLASSHYHYQH
jgi:hypothetical protein